MSDRRRFPRFVFLTPVGGHARTVSDCLIEAWDGDCVGLLTTHAAVQGEAFVLQHSSQSGEVTTTAVTVVSSTPVDGSGTMRFRLSLSVCLVPVAWRSHPIPAL